MSLGKTIDVLIHDRVVSFFQSLEDVAPPEKTRLIARWEAFNGDEKKPKPNELVKKATSTPLKKSSYQNFFALRRTELKLKEPALTFGDLSKKISKEWSQFTPQQKQVYLNPEKAAKPEFTFEFLNQKKMDELRTLCEQRGIVKGGNKSELIRNLLQNTQEKPKPEKKPVEQPSFDVYVSTRNDKRSDFETEKDYAEEGFVSEIGSDADSKVDDEESLPDVDDDDDDPVSDLDDA
ncbi:hypothetical protein EBZ80_02290 [bacterium]|nr:hypothetical protein [bacterium]